MNVVHHRGCTVLLVLAMPAFGADTALADDPLADSGEQQAMHQRVTWTERFVEGLLAETRASVLHPNRQSVFDGLQMGFVNVSSGNLTFERRDVVVRGRRPVTFSRVYDSRIPENADFGPGWRLSLAEEIVFDAEGAWYVDGGGVRHRFRPVSAAGDYVPEFVEPRVVGTRLLRSGDSVVLAGGADRRLFGRAGREDARVLLRRIEWPGGDWVDVSHRDGRV